MKNTIFILLIFLVMTGFDFPVKERVYITDENTDKRFLELINEYRAYYKLPEFKWNETAYKMAKHHTEYQFLAKTVTHYETLDFENFNEILGIVDRANFFNLNYKNCVGCNLFGECVVGGTTTLELSSEMDYAKFVKQVFNKDVLECNPIDRILYESIWKWEISPTHKEVLLEKYTECGFSIKYVKPDVFEKSIFHEGRPTQRNRFYATLNTVLK